MHPLWEPRSKKHFSRTHFGANAFSQVTKHHHHKEISQPKPRMTSRLNLLFLLSFFGAIEKSQAADFCISSNAELEAAIVAVNQQPGSHHLKIVSGNYTHDDPTLFTNAGLKVEGGYEAGCLEEPTPGATATVISPSTPGLIQPSFHTLGGDLIIRDLSLIGYSGAFVFPLENVPSFQVQRVAFIFHDTSWSGAEITWDNLEIHALGNTVLFENVLVDATTSACAVRTGTVFTVPVDLRFWTIINRRENGNGLCIRSDNNLSLTNSIAQAGATGIALLAGATQVMVRSSVYNELAGQLAPGSENNILTGQLVFENSPSLIERNRPAVNELVTRDSGMPIAGIEFDITGAPRTIGAAPDRGAFEVEAVDEMAVFENGFEGM